MKRHTIRLRIIGFVRKVLAYNSTENCVQMIHQCKILIHLVCSIVIPFIRSTKGIAAVFSNSENKSIWHGDCGYLPEMFVENETRFSDRCLF